MYDKVLSISRQMIDYFNRLGYKKVEFLPTFFDPIPQPKEAYKKTTDLFFYGIPAVRRIVLLEKFSQYNLEVVGVTWGEEKKPRNAGG